MADIIQLLPDSVANQIAAGEVIQRPASAVKELIENAIDAGATAIKLIVKDAGKTLIQVIDNGCGMSETDARMCFERHATSKIKKADDLFSIKTFGFRGEALASVAAVAQLEMKTRKEADDTGIQIIIEGSEVKSQQPCSTPTGTSISIKNLFFNVPARRNFLKSDQVELRHIIEEFQRVAIPYHSIAFSFHHNNQEIFHLAPASLKQRISHIFGNNFNERLLLVEESTEIITINGLIGKPEFAKKTRGEQYFFINNRFIKSPYLHHAVMAAYKELLSQDSFATYFLMMEINPQAIDINIHPTKTEIKFEDEKSIYMILRSAVKRSLGRFHITPTLDFDEETSFRVTGRKNDFIEPPTIKVNPDFNPFHETNTSRKPATPFNDKTNQQNWEKLYEGFSDRHQFTSPQENSQHTISPEWSEARDEDVQHKTVFQLHNKYIVCSIKSGLVVIDQQGAHERILYENFIQAFENNKGYSQQLLFPQTAELSPSDAELAKELKSEICALGLEFSDFGKNTFVINSVPAETNGLDGKELLEKLIEGYKQNLSELKLSKHENLAQIMARNMSIKPGKVLSQEEMQTLVDQLFACEMPYTTPSGKPSLTMFQTEELEKRLKK